MNRLLLRVWGPCPCMWGHVRISLCAEIKSITGLMGNEQRQMPDPVTSNGFPYKVNWVLYSINESQNGYENLQIKLCMLQKLPRTKMIFPKAISFTVQKDVKATTSRGLWPGLLSPVVAWNILLPGHFAMDPHICTQITMCKNTFFVHRLPCGKKKLFFTCSFRDHIVGSTYSSSHFTTW